jgi:hypothetical protein
MHPPPNGPWAARPGREGQAEGPLCLRLLLSPSCLPWYDTQRHQQRVPSPISWFTENASLRRKYLLTCMKGTARHPEKSALFPLEAEPGWQVPCLWNQDAPRHRQLFLKWPHPLPSPRNPLWRGCVPTLMCLSRCTARKLVTVTGLPGTEVLVAGKAGQSLCSVTMTAFHFHCTHPLPSGF